MPVIVSADMEAISSQAKGTESLSADFDKLPHIDDQ